LAGVVDSLPVDIPTILATFDSCDVQVSSLAPINDGVSNVKQKPHKSTIFEISDGKMLGHPRSLGVGSQFSLRWFFQHALAWKNHVP
jgi:hypothetical protein